MKSTATEKKAPRLPIGDAEVEAAVRTLARYRAAKSRMDSRIVKEAVEK